MMQNISFLLKASNSGHLKRSRFAPNYSAKPQNNHLDDYVARAATPQTGKALAATTRNNELPLVKYSPTVFSY